MDGTVKSSQQIRREFIEFFKLKNHTVVPSASLIPHNDASLLFTNAGMNQFKDVFLGTGSRDFKRAVDTQKVMRVSGKHNDFDDVGRDTYHHTFFEMLGNWSFGDYYKKEAITWAWELLTKVWHLPKERLYVTVHETDTDSFDIWKLDTDIDKTHILYFGDKENFWEMGATGPCGPCSEIHIDLTPILSESIGKKGINADNPLFIELWNLVFIEYIRQEDLSLKSLPIKHVDTGMGFERISAVLQKKLSNYDSDLFTPIIDFIVQDSSIPYDSGPSGTPHRVIADHIRALVFSIGDGIIPSNEGRGYVIRKILRRAVRFGRELGYKKPFLYNIVPIVVSIMGDSFPEIKDHISSICSLIQGEEKSFFHTLNNGFEKIKTIIHNAHSQNITTISGDEVFLLYDSMGFPVDFTEQILKDENLSFEVERFNDLMNQQKERARSSSREDQTNFSIFHHIPKTEYIGNECSQDTVTLLEFSYNGQTVSTVSENQDIMIILDKTPFYGERGGQIGDTGFIQDGAENVIEVLDTKISEGRYVHFGKVLKGKFHKNQQITAIVNIERKKNIARHHSAAHLLFRALRTVLGDHINQSGSWVGENRTRIDFTHPKALSKEELQKIENILIEDILNNYHTVIEEMLLSEAKAKGAIAAFEEKYGDIVRVVVMGKSCELCGGTHVTNTGELGLIKIIKESSVSSGIRRIEVVCGYAAYSYINNTIKVNTDVAQILKCSESEISSKIQKVLSDSKQKDLKLKTFNKQIIKDMFEDLLSNSFHIKDYQILIGEVSGDSETIQDMSSIFKSNISSGILILGVKKDGNEVLLGIVISKNLTNTIQAGSLIQQLMPIIKGNGGGKADHALARGKGSHQLSLALSQAKEILTETLST